MLAPPEQRADLAGQDAAAGVVLQDELALPDAERAPRSSGSKTSSTICSSMKWFDGPTVPNRSRASWNASEGSSRSSRSPPP